MASGNRKKTSEHFNSGGRAVTTNYTIPNIKKFEALIGKDDKNVLLLSEKLGVKISHRATTLIISGQKETTHRARELLERLVDTMDLNTGISEDAIDCLLAEKDDGHERVTIHTNNKTVTSRNFNQARFIQAVRDNHYNFGIGSAGCGKTYLAIMMACEALKDRMVDRIILCRPAVEAGEKIGFLPGDPRAKLDPYMRPLYDALHDALGYDKTEELIEKKTLEIAPIGFMRGRDLKYSFIILDEAQNTTVEQMKMFLTRLGVGSKMVITGDVTQIDLPKTTKSGLQDVLEVVRKKPDRYGLVEFGNGDVVRHPAVAALLDDYDQRDNPPALHPVPAPLHMKAS